MSGVTLGLLGAKRSGKDTFASRLVEHHGFVRLAFADAMRSVAYGLDPLIGDGIRLSETVDILGWETAKNLPEVRRTLQRLGTATWQHTHPRVWVDVVMNEVYSLTALGRDVVVTDVRFPHEVTALADHGADFIRITRPGLTQDETSAHLSETALSDFHADVTIENDTTIEALHSTADAMVAAYRNL